VQLLLRQGTARRLMHFHQHQRFPPPIRSIASDQIGYGQRYFIDIKNETIFGVNNLGMELIYMPRRFRLERRFFILKSRMPQSEYTMNIFYIIGVVVVVLFVAGFLGLHA
jgi:hypothetical protein